MKSVWTLVTTGLATLAIFSCAVPPAPPPVVETPAPSPVVVETPMPVKPVRPPAPEVPPEAKVIRGRDQAMKILREEEALHPGFSFELVESKMMSRVGPKFSLIAKKKAASDVAKKVVLKIKRPRRFPSGAVGVQR